MGSRLLPWTNNQGYCLQYLLDCRRRSYMGWFITIHQISGGIIWFKNQPACSINGNFTWAEALSMLVVLLVKIPVVFTALDYHQSIEIPTFHAHHLTHCGIPHAPKHSVISPDVFGALVVCFRGRNLYVYMPIHIRSQYLGLAIFAPQNCESIIKYQTKTSNTHTHDTQMSPMVPWGSCVHELGKKKDSCEQLTCLGLGKDMIPGNRLGGFPPSSWTAGPTKKNMLTNGVMFVGDYTFNSEIILLAS